MASTAWSWVGLTCLIGLLGASLPTVADEATKLTGEYRWGDRSPDEIEAVFRPDGENRWTVQFHFTFGGKARTYAGSAEGSLADGALIGTVKNENKRRTFTFQGSFDEEGAFKGTHAETTSGRARDTGTIVLRR